MRHVTYMNDTCHTYEWGMSHIWMRHVTYEWGMSHTNDERVLRGCVIGMCDLRTHIHDSCHTYEHTSHMNESCLTYEWVMSHIWMSHGSHMNESCHTHEWVMSHIWMSHVSHMICVTCVIGTCDPTPSHAWHDSRHSWHIWISYVWRVTYEWVMFHIFMCVTYDTRHTYKWGMSHISIIHACSSGSHISDTFEVDLMGDI